MSALRISSNGLICSMVFLVAFLVQFAYLESKAYAQAHTCYRTCQMRKLSCERAIPKIVSPFDVSGKQREERVQRCEYAREACVAKCPK